MTALERMYMAYVRWVKKQGYGTIFECPVSWTEWMVTNLGVKRGG